jgi:membrane-associated phospholipid phosphatase
MQLPVVLAKTQDLNREGGHEQRTALLQTGPLGLAFLALCGLVALGVTHPVDWWGQTLIASLSSSSVLDLTGFLLTLLGEAQITGVIAVVLAVRGWRRQREWGLGPLLLFVGVGLEVLLKYLLPQLGPPATFARHLHVPDVVRLSSAFLLQVATPPMLRHIAPPYSFPSGHMLRATFLVTVASKRQPSWRMVGLLVVGAMAVTRVYCNEHWVSDVVGGALLGWALAGAATALSQEQEREAGEVGWNARRRKEYEQGQQESCE